MKRYLCGIYLIIFFFLCSGFAPSGSGGLVYVPNFNLADQGDTVGLSIKNIIDAVDPNRQVTINLVQASGYLDENTPYYVSTDLMIPSNVTLVVESGAYLAGSATLTIYSPENIRAGLKQRIFSSLTSVVFTKPGEMSSGWWGDTGDGSTDDTAAIQASINCAEATHAVNVIKNNYLHAGPTVLIPGGVHLVTGLTVTAQIIIKGMGNQDTYLKSLTNATIIDSDMSDTVNYQPPIFRDFAITGDPSLTNQHGIEATLHCRLENMVISWVGGDGFRSTTGNTNEILYSKIQNNGGYGVYLTGSYNTNFHIIGNIIRENKIGLYVNPTSGYFQSGFILNNLFESNVCIEGVRTNTVDTQVGDPNRPAVGIWLKNTYHLIIADNYFENQLNDIYGETGVSFNRFKNNFHGASINVPEDFSGHGGPYRKMQNIMIISGQGNIYEGCKFEKPVKPGTTDPNDWGTVFSETTGTITDVDDGFGYLTNVGSIELTSGDVAAMGITEGSWIHITGIVGTVGTDSSFGLNDHSFQVVGVSGEKLAIEPTDLTGLTYTSGGTVQLATTWSYEYEHIRPGTRSIIKDCTYQARSGAPESIIIRYADQTNVTNINTGKASSASKYMLQGPLYMVYGGPRTVSNMWQGYYYKYFNKISAMDAKHQFYCLPNEKHFFEHITTNIAGEPSGDAVEAFAISNNGLTFTDQIIDTNSTAIDTKTPGTKLDSSSGGMSLTMGDGHYTGQLKLISMSVDNGDVDVSVTHHEIDDPYKCIFDDVYDYWLLMWEGIEWTTIRATCTGGEINVSDKGYPNYLAADHGIYDGEITTLKYFVDTISSNNGTIVLKHNSIDDLTTQYVFNTNETIPSNITLEIEPGAYIDGNATLTIYSPEHIIANPKQRIFGPSITINYITSGKIYSSWYGDDTAALQAACLEGNRHIHINKNYALTDRIILQSNILITFDPNTEISQDANTNIFAAWNESNITIDGEGYAKLVGKDPNMDLYYYPNADRGVIHIEESTDIRIKNLEVMDQGHLLWINNNDNVWIENCKLHSFKRMGAVLSRCRDFHFEHNYIYDNTEGYDKACYGIQATGDDLGGYPIRFSSISFNNFDGPKSWDAIMCHDVLGIRIIGNEARDVRQGLDLSCYNNDNVVRDAVVANNIFIGTDDNNWGATPGQNSGIHIVGKDPASGNMVENITITGNVIKNFNNFYGSAGGAGILLTHVKNVTVSNNSIIDIGNASSHYGGIMLNGKIWNTTINNCSIIDSGEQAFALYNTHLKNVNISDCTVELKDSEDMDYVILLDSITAVDSHIKNITYSNNLTLWHDVTTVFLGDAFPVMWKFDDTKIDNVLGGTGDIIENQTGTGEKWICNYRIDASVAVTVSSGTSLYVDDVTGMKIGDRIFVEYDSSGNGFYRSYISDIDDPNNLLTLEDAFSYQASGDNNVYVVRWNILEYIPDSSLSNQGTATGRSIKTILNSIGTEDKVTIDLMNSREDGGETIYYFSTNTIIPSNIFIKFEPGAIIDGTHTVTFSSPEQIIASPKQKIFGSGVIVAYDPNYDSGTIYSSWYGNDTAALQKAFYSSGRHVLINKSINLTDKISLLNDTTVTFDPNIYLIQDGDNKNIFYASGREDIHITGNSTYLIGKDPNEVMSTRGVVYFGNCNNVSIENLDISNAYDVVYSTLTDNIKIKNCNIHSYKNRGCVFYKCNDYFFESNKVYGSTQTGGVVCNGLLTYGDYDGGSESKNGLIHSNYFNGPQANVAILAYDNNIIEISDNRIIDARQGIELRHSTSVNLVKNITIIDNYIEGTNTDTWSGSNAQNCGIQVYGKASGSGNLIQDIVISNNRITNFNNFNSIAGGGGILLAYAKNIIVSGNLIDDIGKISTHYGGIMCVGYLENMNIKDNILIDTSEQAFALYNTTLKNVNISDCTAALIDSNDMDYVILLDSIKAVDCHIKDINYSNNLTLWHDVSSTFTGDGFPVMWKFDDTKIDYVIGQLSDTIKDESGSGDGFICITRVDTTIGVTVSSGTTLVVDDTTGMHINDRIFVELDSNGFHRSYITAIDDPNNTLTLNDAFAAQASSGNNIYVVKWVKTIDYMCYYGTDIAADDDYIVTLFPALNIYNTGLQIYFDANNPNIGACTININALGAKSIKIQHDNDPNDNCIEDGSMVHLIYDGTNFQMINPCAN